MINLKSFVHLPGLSCKLLSLFLSNLHAYSEVLVALYSGGLVHFVFSSLGCAVLILFYLLISGQLFWGSLEDEKSSWRVSLWSRYSSSYHSWCPGTYFYGKVFLLIAIYLSWFSPTDFCHLYLMPLSLMVCSVSSLASFMSNQETSFVTLGQRVLATPLK